MKALYFIALVPPLDIREEVKKMKLDAAKLYGSKHALKSPAHITLIPPFKWDSQNLTLLTQTLHFAASQMKSFLVELQSFSSFPPRVIFIQVTKNEILFKIQKELAVQCSKLEIPLDNRPYHPHLTIAFKDLKRNVFQEAFQYFSSKKYYRIFDANAINLLRHENGKWNFYKSFSFGQ